MSALGSGTGPRQAYPGPALALAAALLGAASQAAADPPPAAGDAPVPRLASLAWVRSPGAESCAGPLALSQAIAQKLGREALAAPSRASLAIEGHVERVDPGGTWRVTLAVVSEAGEVQGLRELRSAAPDCRALDEEIALVIALLIEPGAVIGPAPASTPVPSVPSAAPPAPLPAAPPAPLPPAEPWRIDAQAGLIGGVGGLLPGVAAAGIAVGAHLTPPRWPALEVGGAFWPSRTAVKASVGASFSLGWGSLSICPLDLKGAANGLRLCLGGALGALVADTVGLSPAARKDRWVFYPDAALRYQRRIFGLLTVSAGAGLLVPIERASFYYLDASGMRQNVFQQGPIAGTLDLAVGVRFP
jgi:hypothetical protein